MNRSLVAVGLVMSVLLLTACGNQVEKENITVDPNQYLNQSRSALDARLKSDESQALSNFAGRSDSRTTQRQNSGITKSPLLDQGYESKDSDALGKALVGGGTLLLAGLATGKLKLGAGDLLKKDKKEKPKNPEATSVEDPAATEDESDKTAADAKSGEAAKDSSTEDYRKGTKITFDLRRSVDEPVSEVEHCEPGADTNAALDDESRAMFEAAEAQSERGNP